MSVKDAIRAACTSEFQDSIVAQYPDIIIKYENHPQDLPAKPWVYFSIKWQKRIQPTIGSTREPRRQSGYIMIDVFVPMDSGTALLSQMTDFIELIFDKQILVAAPYGTITCQIGTTVYGGKINGFYEATVLVPFYMDSCVK